MTDQAIENEIQAKGLTAPRITPADIEANIVAEYFFTAEQAVSVSGFSAAMVDRFLGWKLPKDFAPDAGISFEEGALWPSGTNLLHAGQAKEMLEYVVGGAPATVHRSRPRATRGRGDNRRRRTSRCTRPASRRAHTMPLSQAGCRSPETRRR